MDIAYESGTDSYPFTVCAGELAGYSCIKPGDKVEFGQWPQRRYSDILSPIEWEVAKIEDGKALLISTHALEGCVFSIDNDNSYGRSDLRSWLLDEFCSVAFSDRELDAFDLASKLDMVFVPSLDELELLPDKRRKATKMYERHWHTDAGYAHTWTRDTYSSCKNFVYLVYPSGTVSYFYADHTGGVAPACWVNLGFLNQ